MNYTIFYTNSCCGLMNEFFKQIFNLNFRLKNEQFNLPKGFYFDF